MENQTARAPWLDASAQRSCSRGIDASRENLRFIDVSGWDVSRPIRVKSVAAPIGKDNLGGENEVQTCRDTDKHLRTG